MMSNFDTRSGTRGYHENQRKKDTFSLTSRFTKHKSAVKVTPCIFCFLSTRVLSADIDLENAELLN